MRGVDLPVRAAQDDRFHAPLHSARARKISALVHADMSVLARNAGAAAIEPPVDDDTHRDAGAGIEEEEVAPVSPGTEHEFADRRRMDVVLQPPRAGRPPAEAARRSGDRVGRGRSSGRGGPRPCPRHPSARPRCREPTCLGRVPQPRVRRTPPRDRRGGRSVASVDGSGSARGRFRRPTPPQSSSPRHPRRC